MKKILLILGLMMGAGVTAQVVYQEDFNGNDGGWTATGDWAWGVPNATLINHNGNPCGGSAWVTNLTGDYSNGSMDYVTSPVIDCSPLAVDPVLAFNLNYDTENSYDECWIEFTLDGVTWTKLIDAGSASNWYNDVANQWWEASSNGWMTVSNVIPGAAGVSTLQLRVALSTDGSVTYEGLGIDDFVVADQIVNGSSNGVSNISTGLTLTANENIQVAIGNTGSVPVTGFDVCYTINGGAAVCETVGAAIAPGGGTYTFTATEDFSAAGVYTIQTYISNLAGDVYACDDTSTVVITLLEPISTFPYSEGFESPGSGWIAQNDWQIGVPVAGSSFDGSRGCSNDSTVLGTVINGNYSNSAMDYVYSPFFDFSTFAVDPNIFFDFYYDGESCCDEAWLEVSTDNGGTWSKVGTSGTGMNWYNDAGNNWWDGTNGGWTYTSNVLAGTAGQASVQLRFVFSSDGSVTDPGFAIDNIQILETLPMNADASAIGVTVPGVALCGFGVADTVVGEFINAGADSLFTFTLCYDFGNGPVCEVVNDTMVPNVPYFYTFNTLANLQGLASYSMQLSVSAMDVLACNDTTTSVVMAPLPITLTTTTVDETAVANGEVDLTVTDGTAPYTFDWDNDGSGDNDDTEDLTGLVAGDYTVNVIDANGCSSMVTVTVNSQLGLGNNALSTFNVYPNPTNGIVYIEPLSIAGENVTGQIVDATGRTIQNITFNGTQTVEVNLSNVERGVYFINITVDGNTTITKILVD